jgi:hypothetical protein
MSALADVLTPFTLIYELASLTLDRLRDRRNVFLKRCPS